MSATLTARQWTDFEARGYVELGPVLAPSELEALTQRIDDIMLGRADIDYDDLLMQREADETQARSDQTVGLKGPTLNYRKIQNLELDPLFLSYMQHPLFVSICAEIYGPDTSIACYRAMFMNKPARHGSVLSYHQDRWRELDRDPRITVWTALDRSSRDNGCVNVVPGSHRSLINPGDPSSFLTPEQAETLRRDAPSVPLEVEAGHAVLLHNWLVHGSDANRTDQARRAFSVCYMDAQTRSAGGRHFPALFGPEAVLPAHDEPA